MKSFLDENSWICSSLESPFSLCSFFNLVYRKISFRLKSGLYGKFLKLTFMYGSFCNCWYFLPYNLIQIIQNGGIVRCAHCSIPMYLMLLIYEHNSIGLPKSISQTFDVKYMALVLSGFEFRCSNIVIVLKKSGGMNFTTP